jgi:hypothetical protein
MILKYPGIFLVKQRDICVSLADLAQFSLYFKADASLTHLSDGNLIEIMMSQLALLLLVYMNG